MSNCYKLQSQFLYIHVQQSPLTFSGNEEGSGQTELGLQMGAGAPLRSVNQIMFKKLLI